MNLIQISFAVLSFGMILGFLAVVFSILSRRWNGKRYTTARCPFAQVTSRKLLRYVPWAFSLSTALLDSFS